MPSPHHFSVASLKPQKISSGGTRTDAMAREFPVLRGMAISVLHLDPNGVREPHWHPNANELSYCLTGTGIMTIFSPGAGHDTFTIEPGSIVFVPEGYMHHIENTGKTPLELVLCFSHEQPEDLDLSAGVAAMSDEIMGETCGVPGTFFQGLSKKPKGAFAFQTKTPTIPPPPFMTNRYKLDIENINPQVNAKGGTVKMSNNFLMPTLEGLSMYAVLLKPGGSREPHWHPNASELNYLISGTAKITLLSPGGVSETFHMKKGDISFLPKGYLHYIENTGDDDAHFAIFFNHTAPSDIGFSGCFGAYSNEILSALFGVPESYFNNIPKYQQDLLVISGGG